MRRTVMGAVIVAVALALPSARADARGPAVSEFSHTVTVDGCTVRSEVTATKGNHAGEHVRWAFWTTNGANEEIVSTDDQQFTARNQQALVSTATYTTDNFFIEVSVWKTRPDGSLARVADAATSGTLQCP